MSRRFMSLVLSLLLVIVFATPALAGGGTPFSVNGAPFGFYRCNVENGMVVMAGEDLANFNHANVYRNGVKVDTIYTLGGLGMFRWADPDMSLEDREYKLVIFSQADESKAVTKTKIFSVKVENGSLKSPTFPPYLNVSAKVAGTKVTITAQESPGSSDKPASHVEVFDSSDNKIGTMTKVGDQWSLVVDNMVNGVYNWRCVDYSTPGNFDNACGSSGVEFEVTNGVVPKVTIPTFEQSCIVSGTDLKLTVFNTVNVKYVKVKDKSGKYTLGEGPLKADGTFTYEVPNLYNDPDPQNNKFEAKIVCYSTAVENAACSSSKDVSVTYDLPEYGPVSLKVSSGIESSFQAVFAESSARYLSVYDLRSGKKVGNMYLGTAYSPNQNNFWSLALPLNLAKGKHQYMVVASSLDPAKLTTNYLPHGSYRSGNVTIDVR